MALSGMTGFARHDGAHEGWLWSVEARSVNGRNLEVRYRGSNGLDALEAVCREAAQARFKRGQVSVGVQARRSETSGHAHINIEALERLIAASRPYVERGEAAPPRFDGLLAVRGVVEVSEPEQTSESRTALEAAVAKGILEALDALASARREEGTALRPVLLGLVDQIEARRSAAEVEAAEVPRSVQARLASRIADLAAASPLDPARLAQEAALLASRADVREELDRLSAHVSSAQQLIGSGEAVGRRLDFLCQEFMREANTLCSKSASQALTAIGLDLKTLIEQLREQVQNVE